MSDLAAMAPGDHVTVLHTCVGPGGEPFDHIADVLVTALDHCTVGTRIRGIRCDGTRIEWIEEQEPAPP